MKTAIVLMGHGSADPEGAAEFATLREAVAATRPGWTVEAGCLEFPNAEVPDIQTAFDRAIAGGARRILAAPILLFPAGHARQDMPYEIATAHRRYPSTEIVEVPYLGFHETLLDLVNERVRATLPAKAAPVRTAVLLVGRGSTHPAANAALFTTARLLWESGTWDQVEAAFVSLTLPAVSSGIDRCVAFGAERVIVVPYFLNTGVLVKRIGEQAAEARARHSGREILVARHFGVDTRLVELIAGRIEAVAHAAGWAIMGPAEDEATGGALARFALPAGEIETVSLERIEARLRTGDDESPLDRWSGPDRLLAKRLIYAAGDAGLVSDVRIHPEAVAQGVAALRAGATIVTDVRMVEAGLSRRLAERLGCRIVCAVDAPDVAARTLASGRSRSAEAMDALRDELSGAVVAIGNAPTALLHLLDLCAAGAARPALIAGLPVGFVAAAESKELLLRQAIPFITVLGTRGGSGLAAAAVNTLLRLATGSEEP